MYIYVEIIKLHTLNMGDFVSQLYLNKTVQNKKPGKQGQIKKISENKISPSHGTFSVCVTCRITIFGQFYWDMINMPYNSTI